MLKRRYWINSVFDDADFGVIQLGVKKFWSQWSALRKFDNMEAKRKFSGNSSAPWHYELRDSITNELIAADY